MNRTLSPVCWQRASTRISALFSVFFNTLLFRTLLFSTLLLVCSIPAQAADDAATEVAVIELASLNHTRQQQLAGRVAALRAAEVRPQVSGIIERRFFEEGADVQAGDLLYQINDDSYRVDLARARAQLASARASLVHLKSVAERYQRLLKSRSVKQIDHDQAQADYQQGLADVATRKAEVDAAELTLKRTRVRAPIAGRIGRSAVSEGALVSADQNKALATIQQFDPVYVDIVQSSKQLLQYRRQLVAGTLQQGPDDVSLTLEDGKTYPHSGKLRFTGLDVDPRTGVVTLRAQFPNPDGLLLPGMYVRADVVRGVAAGVVRVPQQAVHFGVSGPEADGSQPWSWKLNAENRVQRQPLQLLETDGAWWIVRDGLQHGDRVVVEGSHKISPDEQVNPVRWAVSVSSSGELSPGELSPDELSPDTPSSTQLAQE
ncbi:MAG: efflux RND transporter periplasmic adaptor subunit [Marinobacterium sp.]|nr:efflux RND transporter periplasmic adaptor subunit [Marinobacterium sp.]